MTIKIPHIPNPENDADSSRLLPRETLCSRSSSRSRSRSRCSATSSSPSRSGSFGSGAPVPPDKVSALVVCTGQ
ncbi:hypothetical protein M0R45_029268 [Rubus argutus]|uniref:Uncharacterized protein n=1 Tax=Rubus argutus TaxID=59490 RepID=A0AAW1W7P6_RUBAR